MNAEIKQRAKDIVKNDLVNMLIGTAILSAASILASHISGGFIAEAVSSLISAVISAGQACFFFRAYNRGSADINDTYALLKDQLHLSKIITIMLAMWVVNTLIGIASTVLAFIPLLGVIAVIVIVLLVNYLLIIVWYLFVANPEYPTEYYLKGSVRYMSGNMLSYIGFAISVGFLPALIEVLVAGFVGTTLAAVLCIPFDAYIGLAMAGFIANLIPDSWFNGTEVI